MGSLWEAGNEGAASGGIPKVEFPRWRERGGMEKGNTILGSILQYKRAKRW